MDSLLFKLNLEKEKAVLAIPEVCVDQIITLYHSTLFAGHQGVVKTYLTIADKFSCIICIPTSKVAIYANFQRKTKIPTRQFQTRININYRPLSRLSMDLKVMPKSYRGHKFILCVMDEMPNYLITVPIH